MSDPQFSPLAVWPAQHRAALVVVVHVDAPEQHGVLDGLSLGLDYTATGLPRLLQVCDDLGIEATTAWTSRALAIHPQLARAAHERGHEISWRIAAVSPGPLPRTPPELLARITGQTSTGCIVSLPGLLHQEAGSSNAPLGPGTVPAWVISNAGGDTPVIVNHAGSDRSSVQIPVSPFWLDSAWFHPQRPAPPSSLLEAWSAGLASVRAEGGFMTVVLHPHISGRPGFVDAIVRFLDEAIASGDVWIARADHLALWWQSRGADNP